MLLVPMTTPEQINATLKRYRDLDELAPEEIRDQWHELTDLIVKSAASDLSTSAQRDDLERLAYTTDKSVKAVVKYSKESCGVDFSPAGEPPATTVAGG